MKYNLGFYKLSILIISVLAVFSSQINLKFPSSVPIFLSFILVLTSILSSLRDGKITFSKKIPNYFYPWLLFCGFVLVGFNNLIGSIRIVCSILVCYALMHTTKWIRYIVPILGICTGIYVFFTYFFLVFPQYYRFVIDFYGYIPTGTSRGSAGYRAGIANHYSQNGIFISVFVILIAILIIASMSGKKQGKIKALPVKLVAFLVLSFTALLLTGKRGVLIFSIASLVLTYIVVTKKQLTKFFKVILVGLVSVCILQVLSEFVPQISYVFERFQIIGDDTASLERLSMWQLAISYFIKNPIWGNGFWSFRTLYNMNLAGIWHPNTEQFQYLDAHNVYIQVLCETGIVGAIVYLSAVGFVLFHSIQMARQYYLNFSKDLKFGIMFSICIQIFYCLYSLSGNCLYDIVFYFYAIALAITLSIDKSVRKERQRLNA